MHAIGVDLGGTNLRVALVSREGEILSRHETKTPHGPTATSDFLDFIFSAVEEIRKEHPSLSLTALGVGSPGPLSCEEGQIKETPNLPDYKNFFVVRELKSRLSLPCFVDNDANCAAIAEWKLGAAKGLEHFILLTLGTGVGGALILNNQVFYGKSGAAAELGHMCLHPKGKLCKCGASGCWEQYVSATAIEQRAQKKLGKQISNQDLFEQAQKGCFDSKNILCEVAQDLALGLGSLVNALEPQAVVLGGGIFKNGGEPLLALVKTSLKGKAFATALESLELRAAHFKSDAGVIGAACMAWGELEERGDLL